MRNRTALARSLALFLVLLSVVGLSALGEVPRPRSGTPAGVLRSLPLIDANIECARLVTPETVGAGIFAQFDLATRLQRGEIERSLLNGYVLCRYAGIEHEGQPWPVIDVRFLFDPWDGHLVLMHLEWKDGAKWTNGGSCSPIPRCSDYVTPEAVGLGTFERYGLADKLENGEVVAQCSRGLFHCVAGRTVGGLDVLDDQLIYEVDMGSRELAWWRIHWREDLTEPLPAARIGRAVAEALAGGGPNTARLYLISPDLSILTDVPPGTSQIRRPSYYHPCWVVWGYEGEGSQAACVSIVDAVTGALVHHHCGS